MLHPRTLLADLAGQRGKGVTTYENELAWREFYADVLWHTPRSAWHDLRPGLAGMRYDEPADAIEAWKAGRTGYPIVDAGMRQLLAQGWMHNRLRMVTASFLTKDLHVWWGVGARHFLEHLVDGDIASNNHGWQWVAGTGTDASPYVRVFNPVTQGLRFDPDGDYVRRWVPELAHLPGASAHEPWDAADGYAHGYPERIIDHAAERLEALARLEATKRLTVAPAFSLHPGTFTSAPVPFRGDGEPSPREHLGRGQGHDHAGCRGERPRVPHLRLGRVGTFVALSVESDVRGEYFPSSRPVRTSVPRRIRCGAERPRPTR